MIKTNYRQIVYNWMRSVEYQSPTVMVTTDRGQMPTKCVENDDNHLPMAAAAYSANRGVVFIKDRVYSISIRPKSSALADHCRDLTINQTRSLPVDLFKGCPSSATDFANGRVMLLLLVFVSLCHLNFL